MKKTNRSLPTCCLNVSFHCQRPWTKRWFLFILLLLWFLWNSIFSVFAVFLFPPLVVKWKAFFLSLFAPPQLSSSKTSDSVYFYDFLCFSFLFHFHRCFCYFIFHDPFNCKTETTKYKKLPKLSRSSLIRLVSVFVYGSDDKRVEEKYLSCCLYLMFYVQAKVIEKISVRWLINQNSSLFPLSLMFNVVCCHDIEGFYECDRSKRHSIA